MENINSLTQTGKIVDKIEDEDSIQFLLQIDVDTESSKKQKEKNEVNKGFFTCIGNKEECNFNIGDKVKITGFLSFHFWEEEGVKKQIPVMVVVNVNEKSEVNEKGLIDTTTDYISNVINKTKESITKKEKQTETEETDSIDENNKEKQQEDETTLIEDDKKEKQTETEETDSIDENNKEKQQEDETTLIEDDKKEKQNEENKKEP